MFENLGIIVKQKTGILWLSVEFFIDCLTQYLSEPMQTLYIFLICQFRHCSTSSSSTAGIVWLSSYLLCLILKVILMAEFACFWKTLQEMVVLSNACIKTLSKSAKIHFSLYFVFLLYNVHVFVIVYLFCRGGGWNHYSIHEKKRRETNIWTYTIFEHFTIRLATNDFNSERL